MIELLLQAERALSVGLLDRADVLYRQVAKADPRNSIAVVGLARVTLDRGDDVGALSLARKAMSIDPENTAAQRMVARLEEVLDFRDAARDLDAHPSTGATPVEAVGGVGADEAVRTVERQPAPPPEPVGAEIDESPEPTATGPSLGTSAAASEAEPARSREPEAPAAATPAETSTAAPEAEPEPEARAQSEAEPEPEPARSLEPAASPARSSEPEAEPQPMGPRRRSWLDRLFGRA